MRCRTQRVRQDYSCFDAIFDGYTSSTALAVPLPLKGKAKDGCATFAVVVSKFLW